MVPSDRAVTTFHYVVNSNHDTVCSGLSAVFNRTFQAINGRISKTVRDRAKVTINH